MGYFTNVDKGFWVPWYFQKKNNKMDSMGKLSQTLENICTSSMIYLNGEKQRHISFTKTWRQLAFQ